MGVKSMRRALATLIAVALVLTSGIGVFAASSPSTGKIGNIKSYVYTGNNTIKVMWSKAKNAKKYKVFVNGSKVATTKNLNYTYKGKAGKKYSIYVQPVGGEKSSTLKRWIATVSSVSAKKSGSKSVTVSWTKKAKASKYKIMVYKSGSFVKSVYATGTSKKLSLSKGSYTFRVAPVSNGYVGASRKTGSVSL